MSVVRYTSLTMRRVVLITGHYLESRRRAGFHWLANAYHERGWDVTFVTAALSWLSWLRRDHRFQYPVRAEANRLKQVDDRLHSFVWFTPWHPANLRSGILNKLAAPLFRRYGDRSLGELEPCIANADLFIFESTPALLLFDRFKELNSDALCVYRMSDDLRMLNNHPAVIEAELRAVPRFDLVSLVSESMRHRFDGASNVQVHPHGVRTALFDADSPNPYDARWRANAVFVGHARLDEQFLDIVSLTYRNWGFHVFGDVRCTLRRPNVLLYGERPFADIVPYVKHADVGLHTLRDEPGVECFAQSLKVCQYAYARLPIVAPRAIASASSVPMVGYEPNDPASIRAALEKAAATDRATLDASWVRDWRDLAKDLVTQAEQNAARRR